MVCYNPLVLEAGPTCVVKYEAENQSLSLLSEQNADFYQKSVSWKKIQYLFLFNNQHPFVTALQT